MIRPESMDGFLHQRGVGGARSTPDSHAASPKLVQSTSVWNLRSSGQRGLGVILIETSLPPSDALKLRSSRPTSQLVHRSCSP
ncbi:hypothetical protein CBS147353_7256 [Aspergillus niger]|nr:hypothetical protein CBS147352_4370 [Aspergillus niger]KAI3068961.1 hypothetical protein CBS147353_7256 [Aspergillus niger]